MFHDDQRIVQLNTLTTLEISLSLLADKISFQHFLVAIAIIAVVTY